MEKQSIMAISFWLIAFGFLTVSCTDDMTTPDSPEGGKHGHPIAFTVNDSQDWEQTGGDETLTRAMAQGIFAPKVMAATDDKDADCRLTLTSTVTNGICNNKQTKRDAVTRGIANTTLTDSDFGVSGYYYEGSWDPQTPNLFYNVRGYYDSSLSAWALDELQYWPNTTSSVRFFAYAPYTATPTAPSSSIVLPTTTEVTKPYINFSVNDNIDEQTDLMVAASFPTSYHVNTAVELPFKHALTCVKFATGSSLPEGTLLSVALTNVVKRGTYHMDCSAPYWEVSEDAADLKDKYELGGLNIDMSTALNTSILVDNNVQKSTLLLIPQTLGNDSKVELYYRAPNGEYHTIVASLAGTTWLPGTTVTYTLSTAADYTYVLEASSVTAAYQGGEADFYVTSYRQLADGSGKTVVPWRVIGYSTDGGHTFTTEKPSDYNWVGIGTTSGKGGISPEKGLAIVAPQIGRNTTQGDIMIENVPEGRGTETNRYDLSTHDLNGNATPRNTANCYVVNAPGHYKIPLVYGNGIKNGQDNPDAYSAAKTPSIDYQGHTITSPYIYENDYAYQITNARIVWQDRQGLITPSSIRLDDNKEYLLFDIGEENIGQGNAIMALLDDNGTIMWSWHIWVTTQDIYATIPVTNHSGVVYNMMPVNLGWCTSGEAATAYDGRSIMVRIMQENGKTATFCVSQSSSISPSNPTLGWNPYYQFGRKDPMLPCNLNGSEITHYPNNTWQKIYGTVNYNVAIQNPDKLYYTNNTSTYWCNARYGNVWNSGGTISYPAYDYRVKKTIYDPCPVGFHVPESHAFTGFTTTGQYSNNSSQFNISGSFSKGYFFWTDDTKTATIFFPALGWWHSDGSMQDYAGGGYYFPASINSNTNYLWFYFDKSSITVQCNGTLPPFAESIRATIE